MIQATGTIVSSNGIAKYVNPIINVNYNGSDKFIGVIVTAEVGEIKEKTQTYEVVEKEELENPDTNQYDGTVFTENIVTKTETIKYWDRVDSIQSFTTKERNPTFDKIEGDMLEQLRQAYTEVQFEIV
jgi:hypothetical protein